MTSLWILLVIGALYLVMRSASRRELRASDPYGNFHLVLNKTSSDAGRPSTEWLNMGYWKTETSFPKACEALALLLHKSAKLKTDDRVLDVGHGCGDSLLLLLTHQDIPSLESVYDELLSSEPTLAARMSVELFEGDAVWRDRKTRHPLSPTSQEAFDVILALDCAYHFNTRRDFLSQSFEKLKPGGRIALADICFDTPPSSLVTFVLSTVLRAIPRANVQSKSDYAVEMEAIGYSNVNIEDITQDVFPGFVQFLSTQRMAFRLFGKSISLLQTLGARFVIVTAIRNI